MNYKVCTKCEKEFPATSEFFHKGNDKDGLRYICKECHNKANSQWRKAHKKEIIEYQKQYCKDNKERRNEYNKQRYIENREERNEQTKKWQKNNRNKCNAITANYRASKLNQTPSNTDINTIQEIYRLCAELNGFLGQGFFHVDHVIPINKGGLHHENNLLIIPAHENLSKSAKNPKDYYGRHYDFMTGGII